MALASDHHPHSVGCASLTFKRGSPQPFGASRLGNSVNFAVFSRHAQAIDLILFLPDSPNSSIDIPLSPDLNRTGDVWHITVENMGPDFEYGYRVHGNPETHSVLHRFNSKTVVFDPYAKFLAGRPHWRSADQKERGGKKAWRGTIVDNDFDWGLDRPLNHHLADSIIYELHIRGYTRHSSSNTRQAGSYQALIEKIPYLQKLGVTAVELLPVTEFDENDNYRVNPETGEQLCNYWGYHPLSFFAPKAAYAAGNSPESVVHEFKTMVKALHSAGIEIILDMVFNHTGEGNEEGRTLSYRGLDNSIYYILDSQTGAYANFSGCGNTVNCNHPVVRDLIIDALCYWVTEMHIDGFRFDLASILGRGTNGEILPNPPLLERIAGHPVLANTKLIAEAWDAAGLYQVGSFPNFGRWAEWNGRFRDDIRAFVRGDTGKVPVLATRLAGSADLYQAGGRAPYHSINFVTSHDGFTLMDLVSYEKKHNLANGEFNEDGENHNLSCNHGVEGPTDLQDIQLLRKKQVCNFATLLVLAHGVPMILAGDEMGRSQGGNNNAWCQDNEVSWLNWNQLSENSDLYEFFCHLIAFRKRHAILRPHSFEGEESGERRLSWHGVKQNTPDWSNHSHSLGMFLQGGETEPEIFLIAHAADKDVIFELPKPKGRRAWKVFIDTGLPPGRQSVQPGDEPLTPNQRAYPVSGQSVVVLVR